MSAIKTVTNTPEWTMHHKTGVTCWKAYKRKRRLEQDTASREDRLDYGSVELEKFSSRKMYCVRKAYRHEY